MRNTALLCYITDRSAFARDELSRRRSLLGKIQEAARAGVEFIQLREKDLCGRELEELATAVRDVIRYTARSTGASETKLLINGRVDLAIAIGADGVHLPSNDLTVGEARQICAYGGWNTRPVISIACHSLKEAQAAAKEGADFVLFAPVFGKKGAPTVARAGLDALRETSQITVPVLALGGVTLENAVDCVNAGAAGIAAIRLFQEGDFQKTVEELRERLG